MLRWPLWAPEKVRKKSRCVRKTWIQTLFYQNWILVWIHILLQHLLVATCSIFFSSVYICSCMFMGVDAWACLCACQRLALTVFLNHSVPCALKQGLLVNMDIIKLGTLVDQKVSGTSCVCLPVTGKTDTHRSAWYFTWTLWVWTQGFMLTQQALYILSHLLSPQSFYIIQKC